MRRPPPITPPTPPVAPPGSAPDDDRGGGGSLNSADGGVDHGGSSATGAGDGVAPPEEMKVEVVETAARGSAIGQPLVDDTLDSTVNPPPLERSSLADYAASADHWLLTDSKLVQYDEFVARGLLMVRNMARSDPRFAVSAPGNWLPYVRDSLISKHSQGIAAGCDNTDAQYASMALANISMNTCLKQPLLRHGVLQRSGDVLLAALRLLGGGTADDTNNHSKAGAGTAAGGSANGSGGANGGRKTVALLKAATYIVTLLTCLSVEGFGREQLSLHGVTRLAADLQDRALTSLGPEHPLSRRLALMAEVSNAAEFLDGMSEDGAGAAAGGCRDGGLNSNSGPLAVVWDLPEVHDPKGISGASVTSLRSQTALGDVQKRGFMGHKTPFLTETAAPSLNATSTGMRSNSSSPMVARQESARLELPFNLVRGQASGGGTQTSGASKGHRLTGFESGSPSRRPSASGSINLRGFSRMYTSEL
ncbi:hypothetical protein GPECTOR_2g1244 [Gonium pectorale]|uniref:Uncharacterized protein n=1 Tax=Gonium pectorale TaxID=33097 RepID=A0A150H0X8_GONPE|nr:hypothetical protein GPECTOR_2g1244 [Gonium pectorale]|eukprot:KXZ55694.1 hypothetical protein GPECTOR_2g1244 [Gonium pectorale]